MRFIAFCKQKGNTYYFRTMAEIGDVSQAVLAFLLIAINIVNLILAAISVYDSKTGYGFVRDRGDLFMSPAMLQYNPTGAQFNPIGK